MNKSRFFIGIIFFIIFLIYQFSDRLFSIDITLALNTYYGALFGSTLVPFFFLSVGIIFIISSIQRKTPKRDFNQDIGKMCSACGQKISQLSTKCPYCGKIQR